MCRSNKAVAPHPTMGRHICLMRRWRVLSGLRRIEPPCPRKFSSSSGRRKQKPARRLVFLNWSVIEDYSPLRGSPCGPLLAQRSLASLESNLPAPGGSHPHRLQMQKSLLAEQAFRIWSVPEDYSPLRGSPCGPLLAQRSLASLESNLPAPGGSHPHGLQMQKSLLAEQAFRIWSVIEDSNLRPLRPERSALPGCANHRMRGASYCADTPSSIP